ncbi:MAG TPA: hypothetical protein VNU97_15480 [Rhizomicrobium sp.]|jgi:hypothetical protein|nr:hypothetical protein [Rhizomicrobium sp.]
MISAATNEVVTLLANVALALSFVVAVVFGIAQVRAAARDRRDRLTLDTLHNFESREFAELMHHVTWREMPTSGTALRALPMSEQILYAQFGQQMETLGILVAERYIDVDLVDKTLGAFVATAWRKFEAMYVDLRVTTDDPFVGEYFQWLAELIEKRMRETPRKPFDGTGVRVK